MNNMICYDCALKHLSAALSYGKEVLSGHDKNSQLDHRIDFLGQLVNAEHHLVLLDKLLYKDISKLRKQVQTNNYIPSISNLEQIRQLFKQTEYKSQNQSSNMNFYQIQPDLMQKDLIDFNPDVIYYNITNQEKYEFSYFKVKEYLKDYNRIFKVNSLEQLNALSDLTKTVLFISQNFVMLKNFSAKRFPVFFNKNNYDRLTPELVQIDKLKEFIASQNDLSNILSLYFSNINLQHKYPITRFCKCVDKHICCSLVKALKQQSFTYWTNQIGYQQLKKYKYN